MKIPKIKSLIIPSNSVEIYTKFELVIDLEGTYNNPYNYEEILVQANFKGPSGKEKQVDGFFMQDFELDPSTGNLADLKDEKFKIRFAATEIGQWSFTVSVNDKNGIVHSEVQVFECTLRKQQFNEGFVRGSTTNYLQYDSEAPVFLIGENMAWHSTNPYLDYKQWLAALSNNGGNFIRLWHAHWGLGIEWIGAQKGFDGLGHYNQRNCFYQDWLLDSCAEKGIVIMLTLQHHGPFSTKVDSNWDENPYNSSNGGPCNKPIDFFSNQKALEFTRNRYRYILARWGYSRSILAWELFNEVDWVDDMDEYLVTVFQWHSTMAAFLKQLDPNSHLVSTSFDDEHKADRIWRDQNIDFVQIHHYEAKPNIESTLVRLSQDALKTYQKPVLIAEFSLGTKAEELWLDPNGVHMHNVLWASALGGGIGTAMTWWWDVYIHPKNLYSYFLPVSQFALQFNFVAKDMRPFYTIQVQEPEKKYSFFRRLWRFLTFRSTKKKASSSVRHYSLISSDKTLVFGFIQNSTVTYQNNVPASIMNNVRLNLSGVLENEDYSIKYYDTKQLSLQHSTEMASKKGQIQLEVPSFDWALVYTIEKSDPIKIEV